MNSKVTTAIAIATVLALSACSHGKSGKHRTPTLGDRVPILASENAAESDPTIADVQVLLPPPAVNDAWTQPGGDAAKSMGQLALGSNLSRLWSASINGGSSKERLAAAPVVNDGVLYVMDVDARVHAFDANTGRALWTQATTEDRENRHSHFGGGVSADVGKLFATNGLGEVVGMDAKTGKILWRAKPAGPLRGAPTLSNGNLYVVSQDNEIVALSQEDGKVQWEQQGSLESQGVFGVAAPAAGRGTVVVGFSSGELNAYRYENGRTLWQDTLSKTTISTSVSSLADVDADPVIDENRVYALGQGGRMVSLDLATGRRVWEQNFAGVSTPWLAGEWLFVITDDARLVCIARGNGKIRWIKEMGNFTNMKKHKGRQVTWVGPVLAGNSLILGNSEGKVIFASPVDGSVMRTIKTGAPVNQSPIVANNTLYILDQKGKLTAYR